MIRRNFCVTLYLVPGNYMLKFLIYFRLVLGFVLRSSFFSTFLASSISFLDSLGQMFPNFLFSVTNLHQLKDQGNIKFFSEQTLQSLIREKSFLENFFSKNIFYLFFLFLMLLIVL